MTPPFRRRLSDHVAAILAASGVPERRRADLAEELNGHLMERFQALRDAGLSEADAIARAIADFGPADRLGRELTGAYRSRLWASTIGVLLPALADRPDRPALIGWLRFLLVVQIFFGIFILATTVANATPVRAVLGGAFVGIGLGLSLAAYWALARGIRWALIYAVGVAGIFVISGIMQMLNPEIPGSTIIPVGAIVAGAILLAVLHGWTELEAFVAASPELRTAVAVGVAVVLFGSGLGSTVLAALPDPTQLTADDIDVELSMSCGTGAVEFASGPSNFPMRYALLTVDMSWRHGELLPAGLLGALNSTDVGDTAGWRVVDPPEWDWYLDAPSSVTDLATGEATGWDGSTSPSVTLLPADVAGSATVGLSPGEMHSGHVSRATWTLYTELSSAEAAWPTVEVFYAHLDRFLLEGTVTCNGTTHAAAVDPASVANLHPFPGDPFTTFP